MAEMTWVLKSEHPYLTLASRHTNTKQPWSESQQRSQKKDEATSVS
jgi:hypothetical protein